MDTPPPTFNAILVGLYIVGSIFVSSAVHKRAAAGSKSKSHTPDDVIRVDEVPLKKTEVVYPFEHERKMTDRLSSSNLDAEEQHIERNKVVVRVPATSANLGPGFDAIGMALDMWSVFTIERSDKFEIVCEGEGSHDMPLDDTNLVCFGLAAAFKAAGKPVPTLKYHLVNGIPYARGLGSSSAAIVGGIVAGLVLAGHQVPTW
jgi:homoserine kinase